MVSGGMDAPVQGSRLFMVTHVPLVGENDNCINAVYRNNFSDLSQSETHAI